MNTTPLIKQNKMLTNTHDLNKYKCHSNVITNTDESTDEERQIRNTDVHTQSGGHLITVTRLQAFVPG